MRNNFQATLWALAAAAGMLTALFALLPQNSLCLTLAITFSTTFYHFAMRLAVGWLGRVLFPEGGENAAWFRERGWERPFYRRLRVRQWKKYMPTYRPETFDIRRCPIASIIRTTCISEITHEFIIPLSFLPLLAIPRFGAAPVFILTSILSACIDVPFAMMQRFNRPRLRQLARKENCL